MVQETANNFQDDLRKIEEIKTLEDCIKQSRFVYKLGNIEIFQFPNQSKQFANSPNQIKKILIFGETGAGKTSLINQILNYHFKIQFQFKKRLIFKDCSINKKQQEIITYYIPPFEDKPELLIIDTPGFGSNEDETLSNEIKNFLMLQMQYINFICFVVKATAPRLTVENLSVLNYIEQIFGLNIENNCIFAFTFSDSSEPQALKSLTFNGDQQQQKGSPIAPLISKMGEKWWINLNNYALLAENSEEKESYQMNHLQWKKNMRSLEELYQKILMIQESLNCSVFKQQQQQHQEQKQINTNLEGSFNYHKNMLIFLIGYIEKIKLSIKDNLNNKPLQQFELCKEDIQDVFAINCNKCKSTCFYPYKVSDNKANKEKLEKFCSLNQPNQNKCFCCCCEISKHCQEKIIYNFKEKQNGKKYQSNQPSDSEIAEQFLLQLKNCKQTLWKVLLCYKNMLNLKYDITFTYQVDFKNLTEYDNKLNLNYLQEIQGQNKKWILDDLNWISQKSRSSKEAIDYLRKT